MVTKFLQKHWFTLVGIPLLCALSLTVGWWIREAAGDPNEKLLLAAYREISRESFFEAQPGQQVSYAAIRGMLSTTNDPYAALIEPPAAKNFLNTFSGKTGVVGLYTSVVDTQVVISIVFPNGAAQQAGIQVGDILLAIDSKVLDQTMNSSETGLLMRGIPGTLVHLKTERKGQILEYDLVRKEQEFVSSKILKPNIAYIAIIAFNQTAAQQMKQALQSLLAQQPTGLILDLRNNEGGDMQAAQDILSYFIKSGLLFRAVLTRNRTVDFMAKGDAIAAEIPLVVLIDKTTYSAAETCAVAIAETGRGKTIGQETYGKGVIQATIPLAGDTMLQMTVAKWFSPKGEWYHGYGVPPQIVIADDPSTNADEILQKALEELPSN